MQFKVTNKTLRAGYQFIILYFLFVICLYYVTIINKYNSSYTKKRTFMMATLKDVFQSIRKRDWAATIDPKDAYLHVPIARVTEGSSGSGGKAEVFSSVGSHLVSVKLGQEILLRIAIFMIGLLLSRNRIRNSNTTLACRKSNTMYNTGMS